MNDGSQDLKRILDQASDNQEIFLDVIIGVDAEGVVFLVDAPNIHRIRYLLFDDPMSSYDPGGAPDEPGLYSCRLDYFYHMGYFEGYPAPAESDWEFWISDVKRIYPPDNETEGTST